MRTAIMTDTNSGISLEEANKKGIFVLPMPVIVGEETFLEEVDISKEEYYAEIGSGAESSTSQPSPRTLTGMWDMIFDEGYDEIIYIPMTSGLSGSCAAATLFAEEYGGRIRVVDNHRISVTQMTAVDDAVRLLSEGLTGKEIKGILEEHALEQFIYVCVNDMKRLAKGGRVTPAGAAVASALNLKPVLLIKGEKLDAFAKVRGIKKAEKVIIEAIEKNISTDFAGIPAGKLRVFAGGTFVSAGDAEKWRQQLASAFPGFTVDYYSMPCSIATHLGIDAVAAAVCAVI